MITPEERNHHVLSCGRHSKLTSSASAVQQSSWGPDYDFPAASADECMTNQLRCFSLVNDDWNHPFDGTIIRMPLRTPSQAERSEISNKPTVTNEILSAMDRFAAEMGSEVLFFLQSVQSIVLEDDHERRGEVNIVNGRDLIG